MTVQKLIAALYLLIGIVATVLFFVHTLAFEHAAILLLALIATYAPLELVVT